MYLKQLENTPTSTALYACDKHIHTILNTSFTQLFRPSLILSSTRVVSPSVLRLSKSIILPVNWSSTFHNLFSKTLPTIYISSSKMKRIQSQISKNLLVHRHRFITKAVINIQGRKLPCQLLLDCRATGPILRKEFVSESEILVKKH